MREESEVTTVRDEPRSFARSNSKEERTVFLCAFCSRDFARRTHGQA